MCRFLLQNGADVDHFAPYPEIPSLSGNAFRVVSMTGIENDRQVRNRFSECQALLLNAGCDPTVPHVMRDGQSLIYEDFTLSFMHANLVIIVSHPSEFA